jgi:hypothetical protein
MDLKVKQIQKDKVMHIEEIQRLSTEIEMLNVIWHRVKRKRRFTSFFASPLDSYTIPFDRYVTLSARVGSNNITIDINKNIRVYEVAKAR